MALLRNESPVPSPSSYAVHIPWWVLHVRKQQSALRAHQIQQSHSARLHKCSPAKIGAHKIKVSHLTQNIATFVHKID